MNKLNRLSQKLYLNVCVAEDYPEQEPAYKCARWYHLFWLLIPISGIIMFTVSNKAKYENTYCK
jgi:hypothetical protein